jgi:hypothetical protein
MRTGRKLRGWVFFIGGTYLAVFGPWALVSGLPTLARLLQRAAFAAAKGLFGREEGVIGPAANFCRVGCFFLTASQK